MAAYEHVGSDARLNFSSLTSLPVTFLLLLLPRLLFCLRQRCLEASAFFGRCAGQTLEELSHRYSSLAIDTYKYHLLDLEDQAVVMAVRYGIDEREEKQYRKEAEQTGASFI